MTAANQTPRIITINTPGPQGPQGPPGFASSGSNTYLGDQIITGSILISGSIIPNVGIGETTSSFDLGSSTAAWRDIYVSEGSIKFIKSGSTEIVLSAKDGGISVNGGSTISADGVSGQFFTSKSLSETITVKDSNNSLLMGPIEVETDKEIIVEEGSDLTIFGDIENTTPDDLSIRTLNVNSTTTLNGTLTVSNNINTSGKVNSTFYTNTKDINSDVFINNNESALIIGETIIEEDKEISIEDDSELTIFGDIEITNVANAENSVFAISSSYSSEAISSSFATTASYVLNSSCSCTPFPYSGSAVISGSLFVHDNGSTIMDVSAGYFNDNGGVRSVLANDRILKDANGNNSINWDQRFFTNADSQINLELNDTNNIYGFASASVSIIDSTPTGNAHTNAQIAFAQSGSNFFIYVYIGGQWRSASLS